MPVDGQVGGPDNMLAQWMVDGSMAVGGWSIVPKDNGRTAGHKARSGVVGDNSRRWTVRRDTATP